MLCIDDKVVVAHVMQLTSGSIEHALILFPAM